MARMRVALAQLNTVVGDLDGNVVRILDALDEAERAGADIAVFPELAITGYPPEDLVLKPGFVADNRAALDKVAARTGRCVAVVGFVDAARDLHNAAAVCAHGEVQGVYRKRLLPNYAVFDEQRTFVPGDEPLQLYVVAGIAVGVSICEDAWSPTGPIAAHAAGGAEVVVNLNASPFYAGRARRARAHAGDPRGGRVVRAGLREPGRGTGRARLRRRVTGLRRERVADRACAPVRRRSHRGRPRRRSRVPQAHARSTGLAQGQRPAEDPAQPDTGAS